MTQDQDAIHDAVAQMTKAFENKDIDRVMQSYAPGAVVLFTPDAPVSDPAQLTEMFTAMSAVNPQFDYPNGYQVIVSGDTALHIAPWAMTGKAPDGQSIEQSGLSVAVFRQQADGSWKMVIDNPHGAALLP